MPGSGNDVVDTTGNVDVWTFTTLDEGDDTFIGGDERDLVEASGYRDEPNPADGTDTVQTGGGWDTVRTGGTTAEPDGDDVDLGPGRDELEIEGAVDGVTFDGGPNSDLFTIARLSPVGTWRFSNKAGYASRDGGIAMFWSSFERFNFYAGQASKVSFIGGHKSEFVRSLIAFDYAHLYRGDDTLEVWPDELADDTPLRVHGGWGKDLLRLGRRYNDGAVDLNLDTGKLRFKRPHQPGGKGLMASFNHVDVYAFWARVVGSSRSDDIGWNACHGSVSGAAGPDDISYLPVIESSCGYFGDAADIPIRGGSGNDRLIGGWMPDVLIGGPGYDVADGRVNSDTCRAETTLHCEN